MKCGNVGMDQNRTSGVLTFRVAIETMFDVAA